jgi:hypothetical protein
LEPDSAAANACRIQHRKKIIYRFPGTAINRFARRIPVNSLVSEYPRDLRVGEWPFCVAGKL